jgi:hypothetical protein
MRNKERYGPGWKAKATAAKEQAGWVCTRCGIAHGTLRWSDWTERFWPAWLQAHHPDEDPENENARLIVVCPRCHWRYYRRKGVRPPWLVRKYRDMIASQLESR